MGMKAPRVERGCRYCETEVREGRGERGVRGDGVGILGFENENKGTVVLGVCRVANGGCEGRA